ncbi:MAG: hypothetical protein AAFW73_22365 [Bacteroidota bacterium]
MRTLLLLFVLFLGGVVLESCCNDPDECFDLAALTLKNVDLSNYLRLSPGDSIAADQFAIWMDGETMDRTCARFPHGGSSLYAVGCDDPLALIQDAVVDVSIRSNEDLSPSYPAGSELKSLFRSASIDRSCWRTCASDPLCFRDLSLTENQAGAEALVNVMAEFTYLRDQGRTGADTWYLLVLQTEEAVLTQVQQFQFRIEFASGTVWELETDKVVLR